MSQHVFKVKRTTALSEGETHQLLALFLRAFGKEKSLEHFRREFLRTPTGYSYHGLMYADESVVGAYSAIPYRYQIAGKEQLIALSVDTMIDADHRKGPFNLKRMAELVHQELIGGGISFIFGFPNSNSLSYLEKIVGWRRIGELDYYVTPRRLSFKFPRFTPLDGLIEGLANRYCRLAAKAARARRYEFGAAKVADAIFFEHRYGPEHQIVKTDLDNYFVYRRWREDNGMDIWYILDMLPLNNRTLCKAVCHILETERSGDVICYAGRLPFVPTTMVRLPTKVLPRRLLMSGKILIEGPAAKSMMDFDQWMVNLSNFDVR